MRFIQVPLKEIGTRGEQVRHLLKSIAKQPGGPAWQPKSTYSSYIIGTHDGSPTKSDHREWRFATFVPGFRAMYFEQWKFADENLLYLDRAYLNIFRLDKVTRTEVEFLCLHCDPNEPNDAPHAEYKRGPHLHILAAEEPIPHAHIALNRSDLQIVLNSADSVSEAIQFAVIMLKDEILDPLLDATIQGSEKR